MVVSKQTHPKVHVRRRGSMGFSLIEIAVSIGVSSVLALGSAATFVRLTAVEKAAETEAKLSASAVELNAAVNYNDNDCNVLTFPGVGGFSGSAMAAGASGLQVTMNLGMGPTPTGGPNTNSYVEGQITNLGGTTVRIDRLRLENGIQRGQGDGVDCNGTIFSDQPLWEADLILQASTVGALSQELAPINIGRVSFIAAPAATAALAVNASVTLNNQVATCQSQGMQMVAGRCVYNPGTVAGQPVDFCDPFQQGFVAVQAGAAPVPSCSPINSGASDTCVYGSATIENGKTVCAEPGVIVNTVPFNVTVTPGAVAPRGPPIFLAGGSTPAPTPPANAFCTTPSTINWSVNIAGGGSQSCTSTGNHPRKVVIGSYSAFADYDQSGSGTSGQIRLRCVTSGSIAVLQANDFICSGVYPSPVTCNHSGSLPPSDGNCADQTYRANFGNSGSNLPIPTMPAPALTGSGINHGPSCQSAVQAYSACMALRTGGAIPTTVPCPTPPTNCTVAVTPAAQPTPGVLTYVTPPAASSGCFCAGGLSITADQYCGWCETRQFGFGLTGTSYEVFQCRNGSLNLVTNAAGILPLVPTSENCTGGVFVRLNPVSGNMYQEF